MKTVLAVTTAILLFTASMANAVLVTLTDGNAVVHIDPAQQSGMSNWFIDGTDHMFQQWFWFRVGGGPEASLDTLPVVTVQSALDTATMTFNGGTFTVGVKYTLTGGAPGSGTSDVAEIISITNNTASVLPFHFFQYSDFDLAGPALGDTGGFPNANLVQQSNGNLVLSETVIVPAAPRRQMSAFPSILTSLNDGAATTLSNTPAIGATTGPADLTWAFQWDRNIAANDSFIISKDKRIEIVAEPASLLLLGSGLVGLGFLAQRRRKS